MPPRVDVRDHHRVGVTEGHLSEELSEAIARAGEERGVEAAAVGKLLDGARAEGSRHLDRPRDPFGAPRHDDAAGRVVARDEHVALGSRTGGLDVAIVEAADRHGCAEGRGALVSSGDAALHDESDRGIEVERTRRHERGVLAQSVPADGHRREAEPLCGVEGNEAEHERGKVRVLDLAEQRPAALVQQGGDVAARGLARCVDELPGRLLAPRVAHPGPLRAVVRQRECEHCGVLLGGQVGRAHGPTRGARLSTLLAGHFPSARFSSAT